MRVKLIFSLLVLLSGLAHAQTDPPGWNYPSDPDLRAKTDEKIVLYTDNMKLGNMRIAADHLSWLLQNTPDLNKSIYINGAKIYENLIGEATEDEAKNTLADSTLAMYDLRIQYFGEEANVLNRKGIVAYKYLKQRKDKYGDLFEMLKKAVETNGNESYDNNLLAYLDAARRFKLTGGDVSDDTFFEIYSQVTEILDYKRNNGGKPERLDKISANLDKILSATVDVDCAFVEENLAPKMRENPDDVKMAKLVFKLLLTAQCSDSPSFIESAELIHKSERTFGLASVIAKKYSVAKDYANAEKYYTEALELTEENTKKAEVYLDLARMYAARGIKSSARSNALQAVQADPSARKEAYTLVGALYMGSYDDCKQGVSRVQDRAVFLAAYDAYQKAGDSKGMAAAEAQFPAIDEIFSENKKEGDNISTGCWVNTTTTIRRRPAN